MADELELLRRADPVPSDDPRFGEGPLGHEAERRLDQLMRREDGEHAEPGRTLPGRPVLDHLERGPGPRRTVLGRLRRGPRPRRRRLVWALAATVAVAVTASVLLAGPSTTPAVAAPRPLVVRADSTPVPLDSLAARAEQAAADGPSRLRKGTHVQSWSMGMSEDKPPITLPVERLVRWNADDSHTEVVVATDPRHPGRPVLSSSGDGDPRLVDDGHVISEQTYPPSWSDAPPQSPPPHDATRLRAYLREAQHSDAPMTTPELLQAVGLLLDTWTLGASEDAALARLLAKAGGLRPAGQVTDRLGRRGEAYVYDATTGPRQMLIMDPATGAVLGLESTASAAEPEYGLRAGDVMDYSAWIR